MKQAICWTKMSLQQKMPFIEEAQRIENQKMIHQQLSVPRPLQWNVPVNGNTLVSPLRSLPNSPISANTPIRYFMSPINNSKTASVVSTANGVFQLHNVVTSGSHPARITMQWKPVSSQSREQQLMTIRTMPHHPPNLISIPEPNFLPQTVPGADTVAGMPNPTLVKMMRGVSYVTDHPDRFISDRFLRKTMSDDVYDMDDLLEDAERGVHWRGRGPDVVPSWLVNFVAEYDNLQQLNKGKVERTILSQKENTNEKAAYATDTSSKDTPTSVSQGDVQNNQSVAETGNPRQHENSTHSYTPESRDPAKQAETDHKREASCVSVRGSQGGNRCTAHAQNREANRSTDKSKGEFKNLPDDNERQIDARSQVSVDKSDVDPFLSSKPSDEYPKSVNSMKVTGDDLNDLGDIDLVADYVMWNLCIRLFPNTRRVRLWRDNTEELERFLDKISEVSTSKDEQTRSAVTADW